MSSPAHSVTKHLPILPSLLVARLGCVARPATHVFSTSPYARCVVRLSFVVMSALALGGVSGTGLATDACSVGVGSSIEA